MNPGLLRGTHPTPLVQEFPYRTGGTFYYTSPYGLGSSLTTVQSTLYAYPYFVQAATMFASIAVMTAAGTASAQARLGAYTDNGGVPDSLIFDAGAVATTSGGTKSIAIAQYLPKGWLWLACAPQGAAASLWGTTTGRYQTPVPTSAPFSGENVGYSQTGITAALPGLWGVTKTETTRCPVVWLAPA